MDLLVRRPNRGLTGHQNQPAEHNQRHPRSDVLHEPLTRPTQILRGREAKPITPPQGAGVRGLYQCTVDCDHQPFSITWSGSPQYPDFANLDVTVDVSPVHQSWEIAAVWKGSTLFDYGAHASVRITKDGQFPILKLAHSDELSIKLIQHEFDILAELTNLGLPVVQFGQQPISENGVTCGYRMEKLFKLEPSELRSRIDDIRRLLGRFHSAGFSHGDFSPSNILKDEGGRLVLIDVSFSGRLGSPVPLFFPSWPYPDGIYDTGSDLEWLSRYMIPT